MRTVLLIGDALTAYAQALGADGMEATLREPSADDTLAGEFDLAIIDLSSAAEDAAAKRLLDAAKAGEAPAVITVLGAGSLRRSIPRGTRTISCCRALRPRSYARGCDRCSGSGTAWTRRTC